MSDLIDRQAAVEAVEKIINGNASYKAWAILDALKGMPSEECTGKWTGCKVTNGCYIEQLKDIGFSPVLITYLTERRNSPRVGLVWVENGRIVGKKYGNIVAYMRLPEPYKEEHDG